MADLLESYREDEAQLDSAADLRIRRRIAELTREHPEADGAWPFSSEPIPLEQAARGGRGRRGLARLGAGESGGRLVGVAAAVLAVALLGSALAIQVTRSSEPANQIGDATIESMAVLAGQQPDQPLGPGEYLHQVWEETQTSGSGDALQYGRGIVQTWVAADGTGRELRSDQEVEIAVEGKALEVPDSDFTYDQPDSLHFMDLNYELVRGLPADPDSLVAELQRISNLSPGNSASLVEPLVDLLSISVTPAGVRAAAFTALDDLGARSIGAREDQAGRLGQGFVIENDAVTTLIIVDSTTTEILERRVGPEVDNDEAPIQSTERTRTMISQAITNSRS